MARLADTYGAEVRLFHVQSCDTLSALESHESDSEGVLKKLFALARELPGRTRISAAVTQGDAATDILQHALLVGADLIAVGMHSRDGRVSPLVRRSTH